MNNHSRRQIEIVEFAAKVYHSGRRHTGINGTLYENKLLQYLRADVPELDFYRGQIRNDKESSSQYDIIICKKGVKQEKYLEEVDLNVNIVDKSDCYGVIELKKWAHPKMISENGPINIAYKKFNIEFPSLKYLFVTFRFKDRKKLINKNWYVLSKSLDIDDKFCFFGNVYNSDEEWKFPWNKQSRVIERNNHYLGEYERLIGTLKDIANSKFK